MFHMISKEHPSEEFLNQIIDNIKKGNLKPGFSIPISQNAPRLSEYPDQLSEKF